MRLLLATVSGQGARPGDFARCRPGEILLPPAHACDEPVDGPCGCRRSLIGSETHAPTTTFEVADVPLTIHDLGELVRSSLDRAGFLSCVDDPDIAERWVEDVAWELVQAGARFTVGTLVERRGNVLQARPLAPASAVGAPAAGAEPDRSGAKPR